MEIGGYRFTGHALRNLQERPYIKPEWIEMTLKAPDFKEVFSPWEVHFIKQIPEYGERFLRVVINPQKRTLITYFFDRRLKR